MSGLSSDRPSSSRESLVSGQFRTILLVTFLAWGMELMARAIVPLIVLDGGGDAVAVGVVATAYALPSMIFRPLVGGLVDTWRHAFLLRVGMLFTSVVTTLVLIPGTIALVVARFLTGTGWAFFTVSNQSAMAKVAPSNRRGEASGLFLTMPALAYLFMPGLAVALYTTTGQVMTVAFAVALGIGAFLVSLRLHLPEPARRTPESSLDRPRRLLLRLVEPSGLAGTLLLLSSYSAYSIFANFAPVYAHELGIPDEALILYFPIFGLSQAVAQPLAGRFSDVLGRSRSMVIGSLVAAAGMLVAAAPGLPAFSAFTVAAVIFGLSQSLINATIIAFIIDRAPPGRLGSAMATYSIGYQFATATSSLLWGGLISYAGFLWVFLIAGALQVLTIILSRWILRGDIAPDRSG